MPKSSKKKSQKDRKQDMRIAKLESFLRKTVENKVMTITSHPNGVPQNVDTSTYRALAFFQPDATGAEADQRIGNKVTLMSQHWRVEILAPASGVTTENFSRVRLLIVENLDYTSVTDLDLEDVLQYGDWATHGRLVFTSPYKTKGSNNTLYKVCYDKVIDLNQYDKGYEQIAYRRGYGTKKSPGKVLQFGNVMDTQPANHRMVLFAISDSAVANHPQIVWTCRSIYKDA